MFVQVSDKIPARTYEFIFTYEFICPYRFLTCIFLVQFLTRTYDFIYTYEFLCPYRSLTYFVVGIATRTYEFICKYEFICPCQSSLMTVELDMYAYLISHLITLMNDYIYLTRQPFESLIHMFSLSSLERWKSKLTIISIHCTCY